MCYNLFILGIYVVKEKNAMLTVSELSLQYGGTYLFKDVNLQFTQGNCYGVIGANGAGKSTFLKIISGQLESTSGEVSQAPTPGCPF